MDAHFLVGLASKSTLVIREGDWPITPLEYFEDFIF